MTTTSGGVVGAHVAHSRPSSSNGNGRLSIATVTKRDGRIVKFDRDKIWSAVKRCFVNSCSMPDNQATDAAVEAVVTQVTHILPFLVPPVTVEAVQDVVEQQLMALGQHKAAKEYILHRSQHQKLREERPIDPAVEEAFAEGFAPFQGPNRDVQIFQALDKFARFDQVNGRREVWAETVLRTMRYTRDHVEAIGRSDVISHEEWQELHQGLLNLEASPAMRMVQMAGPALSRCQTGVYNCAFQFLRSPTDMAEELYLLMQGCGVGFSVEQDNAVEHWGRVRKQRKGSPDTHVIEDTTEGWCEAYKRGLETWMDGGDVVFDPSQVRPKGAPLKTKGGRASGPEPLMELLAFARGQILAKQGHHLDSLSLHDINCYAHRIVRVGGVRRSSGISLSDLDDDAMRRAKFGSDWFKNHGYRNQANNSAVYEEKPDMITFMREWLSLAESGSGERGIFNRGSLRKQIPSRRKKALFGINPCGEIILRHKGFCNTTISILRAGLPWTEILRRVKLATIWGTIQSTMTNFSYVGPEWKKNSEEERLLGVDILGHLDHAWFRPGAEGKDARLRELKEHVIAINQQWAARLGITASVATTCIKPGGDSGVMFDAAPGMKAWHGRYFIRRCTVEDTNPVFQMLRDQGVPYKHSHDGLYLLEFPCASPEGALLMHDVSALEQLEHWRDLKVHYTEHNPSASIYVRRDEWLKVGNWVYENWDIVGGLSFYPHDDAVYPNAPFQAIDESEYRQRVAAFPDIQWAKLGRYEEEDMTTLHQTVACAGGACHV